MTVKDITYQNRIKGFSITLIYMSAILIFIRLVMNDFEFEKIEFGYDFVFSILVMPFMFVRLNDNSLKLRVDDIENVNELVDYMIDYFKDYEGNLIYRQPDLLIFEVITKKKRFFRSTEESYYTVKINKKKAIIDGPRYQKPKIIR